MIQTVGLIYFRNFNKLALIFALQSKISTSGYILGMGEIKILNQTSSLIVQGPRERDQKGTDLFSCFAG
jgi:hypothetical protein